MQKVLNNILSQLEDAIRGKRVDEMMLKKYSMDILAFVTGPIEAEAEKMSDDQKTTLVNISVTLHNKVRTLKNESFHEIKSILKTAAAWMLAIYGQSTVKVQCMCIQLLLRSAQELLSLLSPYLDIAWKNINKAIELWMKVSSNVLERSMTPIQLEDLRVSIFHAYCEKLKISRILKNIADVKSDIRSSVFGAMELLELLPEALTKVIKLTFIKHVMDLAYDYAAQSYMTDAVLYYKLVKDTIDTALRSTTARKGIPHSTVIGHEGSGHEDIARKELDLLRLKTNLSLSYVYKEINDASKAMICVTEIESYLAVTPIPKVLQITQLAKFMILCSTGDQLEAEQSLRALLTSTCSYDTSLNALLQLLKNVSLPTGRAVDLFALLLVQHSKEPEFTLTRIHHLQYILSSSSAMDSSCAGDDDSGVRAMELSKAIITDHNSSSRPLSASSLTTVKSLLMDRVRWHRAMGHWGRVRDWSSLLLQLLSTNEVDERVAIMLGSADALFNLGRAVDALTEMLAATEILRSPRTVALTFRCALEALNAVDAVALILKLQSEKDFTGTGLKSVLKSTSKSNVQADSTLHNEMQALEVLLLCYRVALESNSNHKLQAAELILEEWMVKYVACRAWRLVVQPEAEYGHASISMGSTDVETVPQTPPSYLQVLSKILQEFLNSNISRIPSADVGKMKKTRFETEVDSNTNVVDVVLDTSQDADFQTDPQPPSEHGEQPLVANLTPIRREGQMDAVELISRDEIPSPPPQFPGHVGDDERDESRLYDLSERNEDTGNGKSLSRSAPRVQTAQESTLSSTIDGIATGISTSLHYHESSSNQEATDVIQENIQEYVPEVSVGVKRVRVELDGQSELLSQSSDNETDNLLDAFESEVPLLFDSNPQKCRYTISCSASDIEFKLLVRMEHLTSILKTIKDEGYPVEALGSVEDLEWLGGLCWNMGCILMTTKLYSTFDLSSTDSHNTLLSLADSSSRVRNDSNFAHWTALIARLMETSEAIYTSLPGADEKINNENRALSLIVATAIRLDASRWADDVQGERSSCNNEFGGMKAQSVDNPMDIKSNKEVENSATEEHLTKGTENLKKANNLLRRQIGFDDVRGRQMRKVILVFELSLLCRRSSKQPAQLEQFVTTHQTAFLELTAFELQKCAEIAESEPGGNAIVVRHLLGHAIQVSARDTVLNLALVSELYSKLISISLSRQQALDRIEEFEQLLVSRNHTTHSVYSNNIVTMDEDEKDVHGNQGHVAFRSEDIDKIFSICYNSGVMTMELGQVDMAEKFLSKALSLAEYLSPGMKSSWMSNAQEAYEQALACKSKLIAKTGKAGATGGFFFETLVSGPSGGGHPDLPQVQAMGHVPLSKELSKETSLSLAALIK